MNMDNDVVRTTPDLWSKPLSAIPCAFKAAALECAWMEYDEQMRKFTDPAVKAGSAVFKGQEQNTALMSAYGILAYACNIPFHLIESHEQDEALRLLRESKSGPHALLSWIHAKEPTADTVLVIGDMPDETTLAAHLDRLLQVNPAAHLLCGPGTGIESVVKDYARQRQWVPFHVRSVDHEGQGQGWSQVPGPKLDRMVERLFEAHNPRRVLALDPIIMPATLSVMEKAHQRGLRVHFVEQGSMPTSQPSVNASAAACHRKASGP